MEHEFWHNKWKANEIGFHKDETNTFLKDNLQSLSLTPSATIFVPLCGKTLDIAYLLSLGHKVVAAELNESAVIQLFENMKVTPDISDVGNLKQYQAQNLTVFVGDVFELTEGLIGSVDAIYDRAALVALPDAMRRRYAQHLMAITKNTPQLLVTIEYDQSQYNGPPFAISEQIVRKLYATTYECDLLQRQPMEGGLKGRTDASEAIWILR